MAEVENWQATIDPATTAFFFDVDGTLLGFKDRPEDVVADEPLRILLAKLEKAASGALALVSGRKIDDLDRIMAPLVLAAGGTHGAEMRWRGGRREEVEAAALAPVRRRVEAFVDQRDGLRLEDKGNALAVHFRHAPSLEDDVSRFLDEVVAGGDLMVQRGKMVAEVKAIGHSKGGAIATFMEGVPFAGRKPLFLGDDLTDEHGFASVNAMGGISVKVGAAGEETIARYRIDNVAGVRRLLKRVCTRGAQIRENKD